MKTKQPCFGSVHEIQKYMDALRINVYGMRLTQIVKFPRKSMGILRTIVFIDPWHFGRGANELFFSLARTD